MKLLVRYGLFLASVSLIAGAQRNSNGAISSSRNIAVISAEPRNGTIIKQGDTVRLSCRTNIKWFFCVWKGPEGDRQCAIQEHTPKLMCEGDNRITLQGGQHNCDIVLRDVRTEDFGTWMCVVTDGAQFTSDKTKIALEVGSPAKVQFNRKYGIDNTLVITEGETVSITCEALNAHPAPQLSWVEPQDAEVDITAQPQINAYDKTTDIRHTIKYKAHLRDNNGEIKCIGTQVNKDGRTVLYEQTATVKLKVEKMVVPTYGTLTQKIGIISGVLLAVIFLILLCVFVIFAVCKKRRKRSRPPSSTGTEDTSPEEPPIKPIWTTPMNNGGAPPIIRQHVKHHQRSQPVHHHHGHHGLSGGHGGHHNLSNTVSQVTVSTQSTGSNASWEDRSVGGEIEEVGPQRYQKVSPSLHETHFEEDDMELPRTVLHHPDPFLNQQTYREGRPQRPSYAGRPSSSMLEQHPMQNPNRPQSAMDSSSPYVYYPTRRMPTPNGPMTTSVKSVFDCELGCFEEAEDGIHHHGHTVHNHTITEHSNVSDMYPTEENVPTSPLSEASRTSEPRDV